MAEGENREKALPAEGEAQEARSPTPRRGRRSKVGRLLDLRAAETYSGISAWTLRDLIASGELPAVRPPPIPKGLDRQI